MKKNPRTYWIAATLIPKMRPIKLSRALERHPKSHEKLALRLLENGGAWISEHPPGTEVLPWMFASRNLILVGLCQATIMVQSPLKGGSMISARLALDYNRDTYAVVPENGYLGFRMAIRS